MIIILYHIVSPIKDMEMTDDYVPIDTYMENKVALSTCMDEYKA